MNLPKINRDAAGQVVSWIIAILIVGAIIYYVPGIAIGLIAGYTFGSNKDKIQDWIDKNSESGPETH